jgi:colanic acid/amylovoran biosynthesis glycosyltransferase
VHAFKGVDVVFTNTEFSREQVIRRGCPPAKTCVLPVGFDLNDFTPTEPRLYRRRGILNLLSAGRISEEKGLLFVLQGLKALVTAGITDIHYAIAGDGYARTQLEDYVHSENLTSFVSFLGPLTATELTRVMGTTDALLISSIEFGNWAETQACTVQEAMLMKAIPITTIIGGVPESIPEEMKQFAVPQRDAQALARAIRTVYTLQVSELERLGSLGRRFVQSHYDVRRLNDRLIETTLERASKLRSR